MSILIYEEKGIDNNKPVGIRCSVLVSSSTARNSSAMSLGAAVCLRPVIDFLELLLRLAAAEDAAETVPDEASVTVFGVPTSMAEEIEETDLRPFLPFLFPSWRPLS